MILPLNYSRALDQSGRYVIPAHIRREFGINTNEKLDLCLIGDETGMYLGFKVNPSETYLEQLKKFSSLLWAEFFLFLV